MAIFCANCPTAMVSGIKISCSLGSDFSSFFKALFGVAFPLPPDAEKECGVSLSFRRSGFLPGLAILLFFRSMTSCSLSSWKGSTLSGSVFADDSSCMSASPETDFAASSCSAGSAVEESVTDFSDSALETASAKWLSSGASAFSSSAHETLSCWDSV